MQYIEFCFQTKPHSQTATDVLSAVLAEVGFESFVETEEGLLAYVQQAQYNASAVEDALTQFPMPGVEIAYSNHPAEDKNWNEEWEKNYFQPIVIGSRCVVHSSFHTDVPQADYSIVINPQMAFGTGHHETTSLIIEALLESELTGKTLLDMGCGTSILAILARMRGAGPCVAVDIDDWCVRNSIENIALNRLDGIEVYQGDASSLADKGPFDVVIANINRNILLADMEQYVARMNAGATLYISGFYTDDIAVLRAEAERCGLQWQEQWKKNRWAAVKFIKTDLYATR